MLFAQIAREIWSFEVRSQRERAKYYYILWERERERERDILWEKKLTE